MLSLTVKTEDHVQILIGSLDKAFNDARKKGTYSVKELYLLQIIFTTIKHACELSMTSDQNRKLVLFYHKILSSSNKLCVGDFIEDVYADEGRELKYYFQDQSDSSTGEPTVDDNQIII